MRIQMLPTTIDENGKASARQHLLSIGALAVEPEDVAYRRAGLESLRGAALYHELERMKQRSRGCGPRSRHMQP